MSASPVPHARDHGTTHERARAPGHGPQATGLPRRGYLGLALILATVVSATTLVRHAGASELTVDGRCQEIGSLAGGSVLELGVAGRAGVPVDAGAVVFNLTAVAPRGSGHATVYPCGRARPETSNLNYGVGGVVANLVVSALGDGGRVCLYTHATSDFVADVVGYFPAGSGYTAISEPARVLDTRRADGSDPGHANDPASGEGGGPPAAGAPHAGHGS